jgi:hypothetical protein
MDEGPLGPLAHLASIAMAGAKQRTGSKPVVEGLPHDDAAFSRIIADREGRHRIHVAAEGAENCCEGLPPRKIRRCECLCECLCEIEHKYFISQTVVAERDLRPWGLRAR